MLDPESGGASGLAVRALAPDVHTSGPFHGVKANTGTVTHTKDGNKNVLTLSDDFKPPETPGDLTRGGDLPIFPRDGSHPIPLEGCAPSRKSSGQS